MKARPTKRVPPRPGSSVLIPHPPKKAPVVNLALLPLCRPSSPPRLWLRAFFPGRTQPRLRDTTSRGGALAARSHETVLRLQRASAGYSPLPYCDVRGNVLPFPCKSAVASFEVLSGVLSGRSRPWRADG
ncbi:uncharacterized protein PV09_04839 [Verruconis gallopava]|uniref:Uncharacterized protein n=1 Tax=Verruconis gallopava TaxID=253628 RepID=A0A0D2AB75_9PEZI|nr:uncharacterized protein PV09_04839 [Verruconis gallopava]KIW04013.1 hypothetical protein PV09_04839 [Verruconis gallopava]